ncbi:MAG: ECF transporter S component [Cellulosilyticum sp.]|nr:ECF transporter S component [Cellulosilyticum sp.]
MNTGKKTKTLTLLGVLIAIQVVMTMLNIGLIPLPGIKATALHIPVIIGAVLLGRTEGIILGASMGILSVITNTMQPSLTSFVFSPFVTCGDQTGNWLSLVIAIVPRMLIGLTAYYTYQLVSRKDKSKVLAYSVAGIVGSLTNTIFVMGGIYLLFGQQYAAATNHAFGELLSVIMVIIVTNGIPEAITAALLVPAVSKPLSMIFRFNRK